MKIWCVALCVVVPTVLAGCGDEDQGPDTNAVPIAAAGENQSVSTGSTVILDGGDSTDADGDLLRYRWTLVSTPAGSGAALSDAAVVTPSFVADLDGDYVVQLVVNDGNHDSAADSVTITAETANSAPVSNAGVDQSVSTGATVTLNGGASSDADDDVLTYLWTMTSVPVGSSASLSDATAVAPTFTADAEGDYVASLVVSDGTVDSAADNVTVTAQMPRNLTLPDTGQTLCFDASDAETACSGTGQDGELTVNPPSYTRNSDTVTDNVTGLIWQQSDDDTGRSWNDATAYCAGLTLGGVSGSWRLPTRSELVNIVDFGQPSPAMDAVFSASANSYWSSTPVAFGADHWAVSLYSAGKVASTTSGATLRVRCVR